MDFENQYCLETLNKIKTWIVEINTFVIIVFEINKIFFMEFAVFGGFCVEKKKNYHSNNEQWQKWHVQSLSLWTYIT